MIINIYGSTGIIGRKTLDVIDRHFPDIKINLLCVKSNINLLRNQIKKYNPKYVFVYDEKKSSKLNLKKNKTKLLNYEQLLDYLNSTKSNLSVLAVSGYKSLYFLDHIIQNTENLGIASKEAIVSAGHIFKKNKYFKKTNIFPLDSEHHSLHENFNNLKDNNSIKKIIITASGGPFYNRKFLSLKNIKFSQAIDHPKWKMGYKNSIDSATLVNKCLELIEAHYLFDIPFTDLKILIHPQAIVHSAVEFQNFTTQLNLFKNDMKIPIYNFLNQFDLNTLNKKDDLYLKNIPLLKFLEVKNDIFPIYNLFKNINKELPQNLIKFNIGNEFAVELFKNGKIRYTDIYKIIKKVTSLNLYSPVNTIKGIIKYHEEIENSIKKIKLPIY